MARPIEATPAYEPDFAAAIELMRQVQHQGRLYIPPEEPQAQADPTQFCTACMEEFGVDEMAHLPCAHQYCRQCLAIIFERAIANEFSFPPRCCRPITIKTAHSFLDRELVRRYIHKKAELETRDKMYCHKAECSAFIHPSFIEHDLAICPKCGSATCIHCTREAHELDACPVDAVTAELLQTASKKGWKRCWSCRRMVERAGGCPHMMCICGASFCYLCGGDVNGTYCICDPPEGRHNLAIGHMGYVGRDPPYRHGRQSLWRRQLPRPTPVPLAPAPPLPRVRAFEPLIDGPDGGQARAPTIRIGALDALGTESVFDNRATSRPPFVRPLVADARAPGQAYVQRANADAEHRESRRFLPSYTVHRAGTGTFRQRFADSWPWPRSSRDANGRPGSWEMTSKTPENEIASNIAVAAAATEPTGNATSNSLIRSSTQEYGGRERNGRSPNSRMVAHFNLEGPVLPSVRVLRRARRARAAPGFTISSLPNNLEAEQTATAEARLAYTRDVAAAHINDAEATPMYIARSKEVAFLTPNSRAVHDGHKKRADIPRIRNFTPTAPVQHPISEALSAILDMTAHRTTASAGNSGRACGPHRLAEDGVIHGHA
ncbi:hypothetical protein BDW72DRAFT_194357 [Aspergillus terricola var. indicus]